jgi:glycerophosphoryl diester phosphodiesterase
MGEHSGGPWGPSSTSSVPGAGLGPGAGRPVAIAHRAGNDPAALERALAAGVDAVEADLRWDGGRIVARHARRLPFLPLYWDRWYVRLDRSAYLTLDELLERVRGRARLYLDTKALAGPFPRALLETLDHHKALKEAQVSSQHWRLLASLSRAEPDLDIVRSVGSRRRRASLLALLPDDPLQAGVAIRRDLLDEETARRLRGRGLPLYVWRVDDLKEARKIVAWGATGIIADSLELLQALKSDLP